MLPERGGNYTGMKRNLSEYSTIASVDCKLHALVRRTQLTIFHAARVLMTPTLRSFVFVHYLHAMS